MELGELLLGLLFIHFHINVLHSLFFRITERESFQMQSICPPEHNSSIISYLRNSDLFLHSDVLRKSCCCCFSSQNELLFSVFPYLIHWCQVFPLPSSAHMFRGWLLLPFFSIFAFYLNFAFLTFSYILHIIQRAHKDRCLKGIFCHESKKKYGFTTLERPKNILLGTCIVFQSVSLHWKVTSPLQVVYPKMYGSLENQAAWLIMSILDQKLVGLCGKYLEN